MHRRRTTLGVALALALALVTVTAPASAQGSVEEPPADWLGWTCATIMPLDEALALVSNIGQAAMTDDIGGIVAAGDAAATAAGPAADALDAEVLAWAPGSDLVNSLRASIFGVLALTNDLADAAAADDRVRLRGALSSVIQAYHWRLEAERLLAGLVDGGSSACESIDLPSPDPGPVALADLFPESIGGTNLEVQSFKGSPMIASLDEPMREPILAFIDAQGKQPVDLEVAVARVESGEQVLAIRLLGVPASTSFDGLSGLLTAALTDPVSTPTTVDGVDLVILSDGPPDSTDRRLYVLLRDDVIWSVRAEEETLSEILAALG